MFVKQTVLFSKQKKKLHPNQMIALDEAVKAIMEKPLIGEQKKGDLNLIRVYKFKMLQQEFLLAYLYEEKILTLLTLGVHENFYRNLKRTLK